MSRSSVPEAPCRVKKKPGGLLDLADAFDVQMFSALSLNHVFEHSMPITNRGSEGINLCFLDELLRFAGCGELPRQGRARVMDLRAGTDIADLSFHKNGGADGLQGLDRFFRLADILFERQRGEVEYDPIKTCFCSLDRLAQRMRVIGV